MVFYVCIFNILYQDMGKKDCCAVYGCDKDLRYLDRYFVRQFFSVAS